MALMKMERRKKRHKAICVQCLSWSARATFHNQDSPELLTGPLRCTCPLGLTWCLVGSGQMKCFGGESPPANWGGGATMITAAAGGEQHTGGDSCCSMTMSTSDNSPGRHSLKHRRGKDFYSSAVPTKSPLVGLAKNGTQK